MPIINSDHIKYKRSFFSVNDYFLSHQVILDSSINYCIQCPENINNSLSEFYTLLIDLSQASETIWENIYHRTRSEINSFLQNQHYEHKLLFHLNENELDNFIHSFNRFAEVKKIRKAEKFRLKAYNKNGLLAASCLLMNTELIHVNLYRVNQKRATNLYSFPVTPGKSQFNQTQLGRAHRALHWLDILEFKKLAVQYYDFCGWYNGTEDKNLLNINKFKEQFTSFKVKEYSGAIYKNKLLLFLRQLIK